VVTWVVMSVLLRSGSVRRVVPCRARCPAAQGQTGTPGRAERDLRL